ncbi:MAG: acyltransferase [Hymenobacter sp.]|nr:MAG: acyltransferase [Hymenobacter sp.]
MEIAALPAPPAYTSPAVIRFSGLDVLRCFAALSVIAYHSTLGLQGSLSKAPAKLLHNLPVGVDFFFLISGFLITYLLLVEKESTHTISLSRFYARRILRIFPLYYLIVGLAWLIHQDEYNSINFTSYLTFTGNFWMIEHDWTVATLNPLWSLCIEEQFYLLIPLLVLALPTQKLPWLFGLIIGLSLAFRAYITITTPLNWMILYCHTLSRCDVLAIGGLLAWRHFTQPIRWQFPRWALVLAIGYSVLLVSVTDVYDFTSLAFATFKKYLYLAPLLFIFCFTLFNYSAKSTDSPLLGKLKKQLNYLGKISYGLYMYHSPIIFFLDTNPQFYDHNPALRLLAIFSLTIGVSALSYALFEKQILRLRHRFEVVQTARA